MYVRVLQDDLHFPDDRAIDQDTKSLIRGVSHMCFMLLSMLMRTYSFCNAILDFVSANLG